jgi:RAT1-interacting protein
VCTPPHPAHTMSHIETPPATDVLSGEGAIFLSEWPVQGARPEHQDERQQRMCYWGYRFEHYGTVAVPGEAPDPIPRVNSSEEYCVVVSSRLGRHPLLFSGEVDCVRPGQPTGSAAVHLRSSLQKRVSSPSAVA